MKKKYYVVGVNGEIITEAYLGYKPNYPYSSIEHLHDLGALIIQGEKSSESLYKYYYLEGSIVEQKTFIFININEKGDAVGFLTGGTIVNSDEIEYLGDTSLELFDKKVNEYLYFVENGILTKKEFLFGSLDQDRREFEKRCFKIIDDTSNYLINKGFEFDDNFFSLSLAAQSNWSTLYSFWKGGDLSNSITISTKLNSSYLLTEEKMSDFFQTGFNTVNSVLAEGRQLKQSLQGLTLEELRAWVDPRTTT